MQKFKRFMGVALAATMVIGSSVTAFAEDPVTNGGTTGTGTSEGHVDKHVINVVLPTIAEGATPFAYTMDAERLVQETDGAKYGDATFPAAASDTGVYFLTGSGTATTTYTKKATAPDGYDEATNTAFASLPQNPSQTDFEALNPEEQACYDVTTTSGGATYANTSEELKVTSKSSADVKLTVEVAVTPGANDITLVDAAPGADVTDPQLYLGLKVGSQTAPVKKDGSTKAEVTIQGKDSNFTTVVDDDGKYVYAEKEVAAGDPALTWNEESISLTGAVSKASAKDLTAPTLSVTWKYEDPEAPAEPETPSPSLSVNTVSPTSRVVTISNGTLKSATLKKSTGDVTLGSKHYTAEGNTITFAESVLKNNPGVSIVIEFNEGGTATLTIGE